MPNIRESLRVIGRSVLWGLLDARQNLATVLVTTAVVASTLLVSSLALLAYRNVDSFAGRSITTPQMVVYLAPDVDSTRSEEIAKALQAIPAVHSVRLVSAAEARSRLIAFFARGGASVRLYPWGPWARVACRVRTTQLDPRAETGLGPYTN
jgi:cell division protein FtsX